MSHLSQGLVSFLAALLAIVPLEESRCRAANAAAVLIGLLVGLR